MATNRLFVDSALRNWKSNVDGATKFFSALSKEQLLKEIVPGKNRLIYVWGHLAAFNDGLIPLLDIGKRFHPELDEAFVRNPDRSIEIPFDRDQLDHIWRMTNEVLWAGFAELSPDAWLERHTAVSAEDFEREPHRNRFNVLIGRTAHLAYHFGQVKLAPNP